MFVLYVKSVRKILMMRVAVIIKKVVPTKYKIATRNDEENHLLMMFYMG